MCLIQRLIRDHGCSPDQPTDGREDSTWRVDSGRARGFPESAGVGTRNPHSLAIMALGAGLVLAIAGVGLIAAVGHTVPTQLWTVITSLSGALLGMLIPSPQQRRLDKRGKGAVVAAPSSPLAGPQADASAVPAPPPPAQSQQSLPRYPNQ